MAHPRSGKIFVLVPEDLADVLLAPLRDHYRNDPVIEAIVERRDGERRGIGRRMLGLPVDDNRRRRSERRQRADRRAPLLPRDLSESLPADLAAHASRLRWAQRLDPITPHHQALPTQVLIEAIRVGHLTGTAELYWRCHQRIYQRLRSYMDARTADEKTKHAFGRVLDRIDEFDARGYRGKRASDSTPFDLFLEDVVDDLAAETALARIT